MTDRRPASAQDGSVPPARKPPLEIHSSAGEKMSNVDLIQELKRRGEGGLICGLAVGFPDQTLFVGSAAQEALKELQDVIDRGGIPLGFMRIDKIEEEKLFELTIHVLDEYEDADREHCLDVLQKIGQNMKMNLEHLVGPGRN
jgi:hypothetical protein